MEAALFKLREAFTSPLAKKPFKCKCIDNDMCLIALTIPSYTCTVLVKGLQ